MYLDLKTNQEKIGSHVTYDEANVTSNKVTPGYSALMKAGMLKNVHIESNGNENVINIMKRHQQSKLLKRASKDSAGLDLYAIEAFQIPHTLLNQFELV